MTIVQSLGQQLAGSFVAYNTIVAVLEDRSTGVGVDGYDGGDSDAFRSCNGTGNTAGNVQVAVELLAGHAHIPFIRNILQGFEAGREEFHGSIGAGQVINRFMFSLSQCLNALTTRSASTMGVSMGMPTVKS